MGTFRAENDAYLLSLILHGYLHYLLCHNSDIPGNEWVFLSVRDTPLAPMLGKGSVGCGGGPTPWTDMYILWEGIYISDECTIFAITIRYRPFKFLPLTRRDDSEFLVYVHHVDDDDDDDCCCFNVC